MSLAISRGLAWTRGDGKAVLTPRKTWAPVGASDGGASPCLLSAEKAVPPGPLAQLRPTVNLTSGQDPACLQRTEPLGGRTPVKPR